MKKWTKTFLLVIAVVSAISMMSMTAFAAEGDVIDESFSGVKIPAEELTEGGETVTMPDETTDPAEIEDVPVVDDVVSDDGISDETVRQRMAQTNQTARIKRMMPFRWTETARFWTTLRTRKAVKSSIPSLRRTTIHIT